MLDRVKLSIRMFHNVLDLEVKSNIDACMLDLQRVGVNADIAKSTSEDPLIYKAAELYCKWQYDFNNKGDQYRQAYEKLRDALSLCDTHKESVKENV